MRVTLAVLFVVTASTLPLPAQNWVTHPNNGHQYALIPAQTWKQARATALGWGGDLATIRSTNQNNWVYFAIGPRNLWIGLTDEAVEGQWAWSSGEPLTYQNWASGEPSNAPGEDYALLSSGGWSDADASQQHEGVAERRPGAIIGWGNPFYNLTQIPTSRDFTQVAGGGVHSVGLRANGSIASWGWDNYGQVSQTPAGQTYVLVAPGYDHSLALRSDGSLVSWGRDDAGQVSSTPTGTGFTQISAGSNHSLALDASGAIVSWGDDTHGQVSKTPTGTGFTQLSGGHKHSLALRADGSIVGWGDDASGQISRIPAGNDFTQVAAGEVHCLALRTDGSIASWGTNYYGVINRTPTDTDFTKVAAGYGHSLALRADGSIAAWGYNFNGQADEPTGKGYTQVAAGGWHSLALADQTATYTTFGASCGATPPALTTPPGTRPALGQSFDLDITNLGWVQPGVVFLGASNQTWGQAQLPVDLSLIGMTSCTLYVSGEIQSHFTTGLFSSSYRWTVTIPNQTTLLGLEFHNQAFVFDPAANPLGVAATNAGTATIGF